MEIRVYDIEQGQKIQPFGDINPITSPELRRICHRVLANKPSKIIIDLSEVEKIDTSGLATIIECQRSAENHQCEVEISVERQDLLEIIKLARLDTFFRINQ